MPYTTSSILDRLDAVSMKVREVIAALEADGWSVAWTRGSHR